MNLLEIGFKLTLKTTLLDLHRLDLFQNRADGLGRIVKFGGQGTNLFHQNNGRALGIEDQSTSMLDRLPLDLLKVAGSHIRLHWSDLFIHRYQHADQFEISE